MPCNGYSKWLLVSKKRGKRCLMEGIILKFNDNKFEDPSMCAGSEFYSFL